MKDDVDDLHFEIELAIGLKLYKRYRLVVVSLLATS